jgi:hypothetical protein
VEAHGALPRWIPTGSLPPYPPISSAASALRCSDLRLGASNGLNTASAGAYDGQFTETASKSSTNKSKHHKTRLGGYYINSGGHRMQGKAAEDDLVLERSSKGYSQFISCLSRAFCIAQQRYSIQAYCNRSPSVQGGKMQRAARRHVSQRRVLRNR